MAQIVSKGYEFVVSDTPIIKEERLLKPEKFIFSIEKNRIFQLLSCPTINKRIWNKPLIDTFSYVSDFLFISADSCYRVTRLPLNFNYREYCNDILKNGLWDMKKPKNLS